MLAIVSHLNAPRVPGCDHPQPDARVEGQQLRVFFDDQIHYNNQPAAIDAGRRLNPKTAQNQVYGAIAWGFGLMTVARLGSVNR